MNKNVPELFGSMVFSETVMKERLPEEVFRSLVRTMAIGRPIDATIADTVAAAMKDWAVEKGATHYTHWFQPLTGVAAEKHDSFITPVGGCRVLMEFSGKELIKGETDASTFPSGGLRATFEARGYTAWDPASYAFVKDGTLYIPTAFCSYLGEALDSKTPLLRANEAINREGLRLLRLFGDDKTERLTTTVGAEQEYFLIDKNLYDRRKDLFYTGRTLFGAPAPKGQELEDHYFGPLKTRVSEFMQDLDNALWEQGILAKTKHNEAAPSQHELAPIFCMTNMAVDQNVLMMETMKKVAEKHGLVCLLHEKPYAGVNGSGKHNNWSLNTDTGINLLKPGKKPEENRLFLLVLAGIIRAVDDYQDLMRLSTAYAGNDHRLGEKEAPPAIISVFVGDALGELLDSIMEGKEYVSRSRAVMDLGAPSVPTFRRDTTDRNRTSPFAFTGNKFEFRMPGSSQNMAMPNMVLNTAVAESFRAFADELEKVPSGDPAAFDAAVADLTRRTLCEHRRILFDGNSYSEEWKKEAEKRGLANLPDSPSAYAAFGAEKNVALFERHGVMSRTEIESRQEILFENYAKIINIEALTMAEMASKDILPSVLTYEGHLAEGIIAKDKVAGVDVSCKAEKKILEKLSALTDRGYVELETLKNAEAAAAAVPDMADRAVAYRDTVIPAMKSLRSTVDEMETLTSSHYWPLPSYGDMMFWQ